VGATYYRDRDDAVANQSSLWHVSRKEMLMKIGLLVGGLLVSAGSGLGAGPMFDVHVSPSVSAAPATVRIRVTVAPAADNRAVAIAVDSDDFFRSSEVALEGDRAPRTIFIEYKSLPPGRYEIRGVLVGSRGQQVGVARSGIVVTGIADSDRYSDPNVPYSASHSSASDLSFVRVFAAAPAPYDANVGSETRRRERDPEGVVR
jgi:hypothetical protein